MVFRLLMNGQNEIKAKRKIAEKKDCNLLVYLPSKVGGIDEQLDHCMFGPLCVMLAQTEVPPIQDKAFV